MVFKARAAIFLMVCGVLCAAGAAIAQQAQPAAVEEPCVGEVRGAAPTSAPPCEGDTTGVSVPVPYLGWRWVDLNWERKEWSDARLRFSIDYTLVTDYIFRGINMSEYTGEETEDLNHQLGVAGELETPYGELGVGSWFDWWGGLDEVTGDSDDHLVESDFSAWWGLPIRPLGTKIQLGWTWREYCDLPAIDHTHEFWVKWIFDDRLITGRENAFINLYALYGLDADHAPGDSWIEIGAFHEFSMADVPYVQDTPLRGVTVTPSLVLGADHRYLDDFVPGVRESTKLAFLNYGIAVGYDILEGIGAEEYGSLKLIGFLNFSQGFRDDALDDEFYGGMKIGYHW